MAVIQLAIKVDVDTCIGLKEGVPNLLALFRRCSVPASFFIAFGPDNSGKAIRRVFTRGFLWRTPSSARAGSRSPDPSSDGNHSQAERVPSPVRWSM
jgi:hypothetical protein